MPWKMLVFESPVAETGKNRNCNRTATGSNRTFGCGWTQLQLASVAVAENGHLPPTVCGRLQLTLDKGTRYTLWQALPGFIYGYKQKLLFPAI